MNAENNNIKKKILYREKNQKKKIYLNYKIFFNF